MTQMDLARAGWDLRVRELVRRLFGAVPCGLAACAARVRPHAVPAAGLHACSLFFAAVLAAGFAYALAVPTETFAYDLSLAWALAQMACAALSVWLIARRAALARPFAVASTLACCALAAVDLFACGSYATVVTRLGAPLAAAGVTGLFAGSLAAAAYLALSPRAAALLHVPLGRTAYARGGHSYDEPLGLRVRTWVFWRDLLIYFMAFSFLGHWGEMWFCYHIYLGVFMGDYNFGQLMLWHQWLFPYLAEGVALVLVVVLLHPLKQALLKRFSGRVLPALLASVAIIAAACVCIDFTAGMICNQDYSVWDYRDLPFNFMGQVCLQNALVYTTAATLIVWVVYPLMDTGLRRLPRACADGIFVALTAVFAFCAALHFTSFFA